MDPWRDAALERNYQSLIALPLISDGQTFGTLALYAGEADAFDADEVSVLTELADDLVFGLNVLQTRREREHVAAAFQESQARVEEVARQVLEHSPDPIARLDRDGRYLYVNSVYERLVGLPGTELLGRRIGEPTATHMPSSVPPQILTLCHVTEQGRRTGIPVEAELSANLPAGARTFEIRLTPERDDAGQVAGMLLIGRDVTERRHVEEQSRLAERLEAIGLAERLKIERPATRVLFTSGYADSPTALQDHELRPF